MTENSNNILRTKFMDIDLNNIIINSKRFKDWSEEEKDSFIEGYRTGSFTKGTNLGNAYGAVDFLHGGYDKEGNIYLYMFDTYDFNKNETNPAVEAGRRQMMKGNLKGFFSVHEIVLTRNELKKYGI